MINAGRLAKLATGSFTQRSVRTPISKRSISTYIGALAAKAVYAKQGEPSKLLLPGFGAPLRVHIGPYERFELAYWKNDKESVVAIRGSAIIDDWILSNFPMQFSTLPIRFEHTINFIEKCIQDSGDKPLTTVGHSLGGGMAQLCGTKLDCKIMTYNPPPMRSLLDGTLRFNLKLTPEQTERARNSKTAKNYYTTYDPVSRVPGLFVGSTDELISYEMNPLTAHGMEEVLRAVDKSEHRDVDNLEC